MVSQQPSRRPVDPYAVHDALVQLLEYYQMRNIPQMLDLFAHLQLVSTTIRAQARRALRRHNALADQLMAHGVDERDWLRYGALNKPQGRKLKRLAAEQEEDAVDDVQREDQMMELSFQLRLIHILELLSKPGVALKNVQAVLDLYFPDIPATPTDDATPDDIAQWRRVIHATPTARCFIRAMSPDQARRYELFKIRASSMLHSSREAEETENRRLAKKAMMPDLADDQEEAVLAAIGQGAREVIEDVKQIQALFEPDKEARKASAVREGEKEAAEFAEDMDMESDRLDGEGQEVYEPDYAQGDETGNDEGDGQHDGDEEDEEDDEGEEDEEELVEYAAPRSPPPIRAPRASMDAIRNARHNSTAQPVPLTKHNKPTPKITNSSPRSPGSIKKGRPSGLPPLTGPNYVSTSPASSSPTEKRHLKPFSQNKLQNRGVPAAAGAAKRSRLSLGVSAASYDPDARDAKRQRARSDE